MLYVDCRYCTVADLATTLLPLDQKLRHKVWSGCTDM